MRYHGKIREWNDERGFGFIDPDGIDPYEGDERVFFHIKSLSDRKRRPRLGEFVSFEMEKDPKGRLRATRVSYLVARGQTGLAFGPWVPAALVAAAVFAVVIGLVVTERLPFGIAVVYFVASILAFSAYATDKDAARRGGWRTPEASLHFLALIGGWPGALVAQRLLRHKSRKASFLAVYWLTVFLNCVGLGLATTPMGAEVLGVVARELRITR